MSNKLNTNLFGDLRAGGHQLQELLRLDRHLKGHSVQFVPSFSAFTVT
jgi:hypothetical protein